MRMKGKLLMIISSNILMLSVAKVFSIFKFNYLVELILKQININMDYVKGVIDNE